MNLEEKKKLLAKKIAETDNAYLIENMLNFFASEETVAYGTASETHKKRMDALLERSIQRGLEDVKVGRTRPLDDFIKEWKS